MKDNNGIKSWNFVPNKENEDAYEKIIADIQNISQQYLNSDIEIQNEIIEAIFLKIREINVFPVIYFSEAGIAAFLDKQQHKLALEKQYKLGVKKLFGFKPYANYS